MIHRRLRSCLPSLCNAGKDGDTQQFLSPALQPLNGQKSSLSSASASASLVTIPTQSVPAADKGTSDPVHTWSTKGDTAAENSDSPITPLQADPAYPQQLSHTYTPSESGSGTKPSTGPESVAKHAQQSGKGKSGGQPQSLLEGRFDQVNRDVADSVNDSINRASMSEHSPKQQRSAAENGGTDGHVQAQLSSPQSCPSTPASQIDNTHGSDDAYRSVTHVNSCFAKSDDEGEHDDIPDSSSKSSQLVRDDDETDAAATVQHNDEEDQSLSISDKLQSSNHDLKAALKAKAQVNIAAFCTWGPL